MPIRKSIQSLAPYTPGEQPSGDGIVKLNTNENPYPPSPKVTEALARFASENLRLYPDPVCLELRERLARLHACRPEQVFVGNGSDEILALCLRAFVERKGQVGFFDPSYSLYPVLAAIEEVTARPVPLGKDFEWNMPADYRASLFFLCHPNAPTSILYPRETVESFCKSFSGVVVIDEAYVDFSSRHCLDLALKSENVLVARTLSKSFSLAGLRLGYAIGPESLISALFKIKDSYNVSRLSQTLALVALGDLDHMKRNVERIKKTRSETSAELTKRGWQVFASESNFLWAKPRTMSAERVFRELRKRRIYVRYFPGPRTGDYLRITVGTDKDMDLFLQTLDSIR